MMSAIAGRFSAGRTHRLVFIFFSLYLLLGLVIFQDYGISWDERSQRDDNGLVNYRYVFEGDKKLETSIERYHGPAFELLLIIGEKVLKLEDIRKIYLFRHLATFLSFFIGCIFLYLLAMQLFRQNVWALLTVVLLIMSPRIFADSFYNSKDLPLLSFFIIAVYTQIVFLRKPTLINAFIHALATGFMVDIRITGMLVPLLTLFLYFLWPILSMKKPGYQVRYWLILFIYLILQCGFIILFWPILWHGPLQQLMLAFKQMSHYPLPNNQMLYHGHLLTSDTIPWHYIPVWMLITVPPVYMLLILIGLFLLGEKFIGHPNQFIRQETEIFLQLIYLLAPMLAVIILHSIVYDGWRHLYFIYPFALIIAVWGLQKIWQLNIVRNSIKVKVLIAGLLILQFSIVLYFMSFYHPQEQDYFSELLPRCEMVETWELDYWGLGSRQCLEYILEHDKRSQILICTDNYPVKVNLDILRIDDRKRIKMEDDALKSDYYIANFRFHWHEYPYEPFYSIVVRGTRMMTVYKIR